MQQKIWRKLPPPPVGFAKSMGISPFRANLLFNRGVTDPADMELFFAADDRLSHDPLLLPDMSQAVSRLRSAISNNETVGIFGDFDTDGITGTALLTQALEKVGLATVPYIPDRVEEGHGLNLKAVQHLKDKGVSLLITVDCGATSTPEITEAAALGIDTIVTDHHSMPSDAPTTFPLVNPQRPDSEYPYGDLTGVGMAFKLIEALYDSLRLTRPDHLLELVALGTIADVGPLTGENRYMVKKGLEYLNKTKSLGIKALAAVTGQKIGSLSTDSLSFSLIPRLNVAGRLGHAGLSLDLLTATEPAQAELIARSLDQKNSERQAMTEQFVGEALQQVDDQRATSDSQAPIIIVGSKKWIPGILGLIANRLSELYYRPAVAMVYGPEFTRASARSIPEFNMIDAIRESEDLYRQHGGHSQAAGFTVPTIHLDVVESRLRKTAIRVLQEADLTPKIDVDCEIPLSLVTGDNFEFIQSLAPFGAGNRAPVFMTRNADVLETRKVGNAGQHVRMRVHHDGTALDAIAFRQGDNIAATQGKIDLVYTVGLNNWGGRSTLQLTVQDFKSAR